MYAENTLLSLLVITLCLTPGYFGDNVQRVDSKTELKTVLTECCGDNNKLAVMYIVSSTDEYDYIFNDLAILCPDASFIKADSSTFKDEAGKLAVAMPFTQPVITLRKSIFTKLPFSASNEKALQDIINEHIAMSLDEFQNCKGKVPTIQNVKYVKSETELRTALKAIDDDEKLAVMYLVDSTDEHDDIFNNLAILCPKASFIKMDKSTFENAAGQLAITDDYRKPQITLHKFKLSKAKYTLSNPRKLHNIIKQHIDMTLVQFQASLAKVENIKRNIKYVKSETELANELLTCDGDGKLAVMYLCDSTNEYDYIFNDLAILCSEASFIKMDKSTFKNAAGQLIVKESFTQPVVQLYKFELSKPKFSASNQGALQSIINQHIDMTLEQFQASQTEVPTIQNVKYVKSETELRTVLKAIDDDKKLAVVYLVDSTDEHDDIFNNLATLCPKASFIKIDKSTFKNAAGQLAITDDASKPQITFHRFELSTNHFPYSDQRTLHNIIKQHIDMTLTQFKANLTQTPFVKNVDIGQQNR